MVREISFDRKIVVFSTVLLLIFPLSVIDCFSFSKNNFPTAVTFFNTGSFDNTGRSSELSCSNHLFVHDGCRFIQNARVGKFSKLIQNFSQRYLNVSKTVFFQVLLRSAITTIPQFYGFQYQIFNSLFDLKTSLLIYH